MNVWRPTAMEPAILPQPICMSEVGIACINITSVLQSNTAIKCSLKAENWLDQQAVSTGAVSSETIVSMIY